MVACVLILNVIMKAVKEGCEGLERGSEKSLELLDSVRGGLKEWKGQIENDRSELPIDNRP